MAEPKNQKDFWDKLEIIGKVALPVVVAGATLWFNGQLNSRQTSADMVQIAVGVLSKDVKETVGEEAGIDPLRQWAVAVLGDPTGTHDLTEQAKAALIAGTSTLFMTGWGGAGSSSGGSRGDYGAGVLFVPGSDDVTVGTIFLPGPEGAQSDPEPE